MWIDTHCHLDAREFDADRDAVVAQARAAGVRHIVVPAIARWNFDVVRALAHRQPGLQLCARHPPALRRAGQR